MREPPKKNRNKIVAFRLQYISLISHQQIRSYLKDFLEIQTKLIIFMCMQCLGKMEQCSTNGHICCYTTLEFQSNWNLKFPLNSNIFSCNAYARTWLWFRSHIPVEYNAIINISIGRYQMVCKSYLANKNSPSPFINFH